MRNNIILMTDAYKQTHWLQRPDNITKLYSYGEPRVGGKDKQICFFGLQALVNQYIANGCVTKYDIDEAEDVNISTFGTVSMFNREVWEKVMNRGTFPIKIMTVPEGTWLAEGNVCFTLESTEPWFAPMLSHFEDILMWAW